MKKLFLFLVITIGFICENKAQENSEIYYYLDKNSFVYLVQIQNYGKKMIKHIMFIYEGTDVNKEIQEVLEKHDWEVYNYSSKYSNDKYDTYSQCI